MLPMLWLRLDAPLVSFGAPLVDQFGRTQDFPGLSLIAGLLGNALGYDHRDSDALARLQARIRYAVRQDRAGEKIKDFQTVDLGQPHLVDTGWTTHGVLEGRAGASGTSTHIRYREHIADSVYTIALTLVPAAEAPDLDRVAHALDEPARPLFIGRKACIPAAPILLGRTEATSLREALAAAPPLPGGRAPGLRVNAWWPADDAPDGESLVMPVIDERDWRNQIHVGRRLIRQAQVQIGGVQDER